MPKVSDGLQNGLMIQMIGKPGSGKSIAAASFPEPVYIFDLESRIDPVIMFFGKRDITYDTYYIGDFEKFCRKLESFQLNCPYKTIIIDGLTPLADMLLQYGITLRGKSGGDKKFTKGTIELNDISDYNVETRGLIQIINILRELKSINRILITHLLESSAYDLITKKDVVTQTVMTGGKKVAAKVPNYFNEVWNFYTEMPIRMDDPPLFKMSARDKGYGLGKSIIPDLPAEINFSRRKENVEGSLWKELEPYLKRANLIA